jgi:tyrosine-protein phosphatase YwqE
MGPHSAPTPVGVAQFLERPADHSVQHPWYATAKDSADALMHGDLVHFVASDPHDCVHRPPNLTEAYEYVRGRWGDARARAVFVENPAAVINDEPVARSARLNRMLKFFTLGAK